MEHKAYSEATFTLKGRLKLQVIKPDGTVREEREGDNVMCTVGKSVIAAALVWSGIQDQAANLGVTSPTYLTPLYGAIGTGLGTPNAADTQLFTEYSRQVVTGGAFGPATATILAQVNWIFYFASPLTSVTVTEAGVFANASTTVNSGTMIDHWAFSPSVTVPATDTLILQASFSF